MANKNTILHKAKASKKDEFYTQLPDIERELRHYKKYFKGKVVYVSAAAEEDEEGNLFFSSKIALDAGQKNRADAVHLQDIGQLAEISVKAGQRSVLAYLLSPLVRGSETIFTEK